MIPLDRLWKGQPLSSHLLGMTPIFNCGVFRPPAPSSSRTQEFRSSGPSSFSVLRNPDLLPKSLTFPQFLFSHAGNSLPCLLAQSLHNSGPSLSWHLQGTRFLRTPECLFSLSAPSNLCFPLETIARMKPTPSLPPHQESPAPSTLPHKLELPDPQLEE